MEMLKCEMVFGKQAWLYSIEWQKRGLPHCHILLWLVTEHRITPDKTDDVISVEIPDYNDDPTLYQIVISNMVHGPCGSFNHLSPCMKDGKCTKNYPKQFRSETLLDTNGYPLYRRRSPESGGQTATIRVRRQCNYTDQEIDNKWIVPYNKLLLRSMNCHCNVELCMSIRSIKYVLKYVHKDCDQAMYQLQTNQPGEVDEISDFQSARYISSNEAAWRIMEFPIHERYPPVVQLAVHLQNGQRVYFTQETAISSVTNGPPKTTLTEFFALCEVDNFTRTLLYSDVPQYYTWRNKAWSRRKQGVDVLGFPNVKQAHVIGRMYTINPRQGECFYLRLLLTHVKGPRSFNHIRTVNGDLRASFHEACLKLGLLENDNHYYLAMQEASLSNSSSTIRTLFAVILAWCEPSNPTELYDSFKDAMAEDFLHSYSNHSDNQEMPYSTEIYNLALTELQNKLYSMGGRELSSYGLPQPQVVNLERLSHEYSREINYSIEEQEAYVQCNEPLLTVDQRDVYNYFCSLIEGQEGGIVFLDAPGKTFLLILAKLQSESKIALATASSGIAATLLVGGRTLHSTFKIPLDLHRSDVPLCNIKKGTALCKLIQDCKAIVIDEASMTHKVAFEALDRTLQDLKGNNQPMGGICTLLCGDFRQILPVIQGGMRGNIVNSCLKRSYLWDHVLIKTLKTNMRVYLCGDNEAGQFAQQLLIIGDGRFPIDTLPDTIQLPDNIGTFVHTEEELIEATYPALLTHYTEMSWLSERCILAPLNETIRSVNAKLVAQLPGECMKYRSIDTVPDETAVTQFPVEFLNTIEISGLPSHELFLKVGAPIIILRSLDPPKVTNGTRCIITSLSPNVINAGISSGRYIGEEITIPHIPLISSDSTLPFQFRRLQFPVSLCFADNQQKSRSVFKSSGN